MNTSIPSSTHADSQHMQAAMYLAVMLAALVLFASSAIAQQTSNPAVFTITPPVTPPTVTSQPANATVIAGQTATFTVVASGTAPLSYQWKRDGVAVTGNPTATTATLVLNQSTTAMSGRSSVIALSRDGPLSTAATTSISWACRMRTMSLPK